MPCMLIVYDVQIDQAYSEFIIISKCDRISFLERIEIAIICYLNQVAQL